MTPDEKGLTHDNILFLLIQTASSIRDPGSLTTQHKLGKLAEATSFLWHTEFIKTRQEFFHSHGVSIPDGHFLCSIVSTIVTVEATVNPQKENLKKQIEFYCSEKYYREIIKEYKHEIWFFIPQNIFEEFKEHLHATLQQCRIEREVVITIWTIFYDKRKHEYTLQYHGDRGILVESGLAETKLKNGINEKLPASFPLLSTNLRIQSIMFVMGREFFIKSTEPTEAKSLEEVYNNDFGDAIIDFRYFRKSLHYLKILLPELVSIERQEGKEMIKVRRIGLKPTRKEVQRKLQKIYDSNSEREIIEWIKRIKDEERREKEVTEETKEEKRDISQKVLDEFIG